MDDAKRQDKAKPNPPVETPNELTGVAPHFAGKVSNRPTPAPPED